LNDALRLSEKCLSTLRIELRCHAMYYSDLTMKEGNYLVEEDVTEPDSYIWALNNDLTVAEERLSTALPNQKLR
jgi:exocyst complex component 4